MVGLNPYRPQFDAGERILPPIDCIDVSVGAELTSYCQGRSGFQSFISRDLPMSVPMPSGLP